MELKEMNLDAVEERLAEISTEVETSDNLDELAEETRNLKARKDELLEIAKTEKEDREKAVEEGVTIRTFEENKEMNNVEIRNSAEYLDAFVNYVKKNDDTECRALLTTNVDGGTIAVPDVVVDTVKQAWERSEIMSLVRKTEIKGNLKVGFEISADDAVVHTEGGDAVTEENLVLGVVTLSPVSIKKWVSVSDEALDLTGQAFIDYIYDEIVYKISKKAEAQLIDIISKLPATATATSPSAQKVSGAIAVDTIAQAIGVLGDNAVNNTVVMNRGTYAQFKSVQASANYAVDVFDGLDVVFTSALPNYAEAEAGAVYAIVGDFANGAQANFPNGDDVEIKFDDKTLMTSDLVRILGRQYVAVGAVANDAFALITKGE